jgi:hypothetical protein
MRRKNITMTATTPTQTVYVLKAGTQPVKSAELGFKGRSWNGK